MVERVATPLIEKPATPGPTVALALEEVTPSVGKSIPKSLKQSAIILEEDDENDAIPLASHPRLAKPPSIEPPLVVEATD
ncbi:hypothetical protein TB1_000848 [Malus domestica]